MGALVLAVGLEDRFRVKLAEGDAAAVVTVADLVASSSARSPRRRTGASREPRERGPPGERPGRPAAAPPHRQRGARGRRGRRRGDHVRGPRRARDRPPVLRDPRPRPARRRRRWPRAASPPATASRSSSPPRPRSSTPTSARCSPAPCRCRSTRRCGSGGCAEYHAATAAMMAAVGARLVVADGRTRALLGRAVELARPPLGCLRAEQLAAGDPASPAAEVRPDGPGADPVLVGLDDRPEAGGAVARQPDGAARGARRPAPAGGGRAADGRVVAAALPRHGPDRLPAPRRLRPRPARPHPARELPRPAFPLAAGDRAPPRHALGGAQLRLRGGRQAREGRGAGRLRPLELAARRLRRRAGVARPPSSASRGASRRFGFDRRALRPVYGLAEAALAVTFTPPGRGPTALARRSRPPRGRGRGRRGAARDRLGGDADPRRRGRGARRGRPRAARAPGRAHLRPRARP